METSPRSDQETIKIAEALYEKAGDAITAFFTENPTADWLLIGEDSAEIFGGGTDAELIQMTEEDHVRQEEEKGESLQIFGRPVFFEFI